MNREANIIDVGFTGHDLHDPSTIARAPGAKATAGIRLEIVKLLAQNNGPMAVSRMIDSEFGVHISCQVISAEYLHNKKHAKTIRMFRKVWARDVMKHPLAQAQERLNILRATIRDARRMAKTKLYFDQDGNKIGDVEAQALGVIAACTKEAREEVRLLTGKDSGDAPQVRFLQIIKDSSNGSSNRSEEAGRDGDAEGAEALQGAPGRTSGLVDGRARRFQVL